MTILHNLRNNTLSLSSNLRPISVVRTAGSRQLFHGPQPYFGFDQMRLILSAFLFFHSVSSSCFAKKTVQFSVQFLIVPINIYQ